MKKNVKTTIGELIKEKDYDYVSYRIQFLNETDTLFCGCFKSDNDELIPLDDDCYYKNEEVISYEEWSKPEEGINNGLTIVVEGEWII